MSETNRRLPLAGWYPDPSSRAHVRYWDGAQWTGEERLIQFSTKQWQQRPSDAASAGSEVSSGSF